ncbi:MAG: hypothetical protein OJF60_001973 [Burkholderiaceae bacterium]|nr:MAG: hypothetical protein OJF60_001973 [Burkholderiaceae bacterium]
MNDRANHLEIFAELRKPDRSGLPKYQRLSNVIVNAIRRGVWRPGDRLPAEEELTGLTPYSLGTVQRALRDLADQRLVVREHGLGSFVAEKQRRLQDPWHCRFVGDDGVTVLPIYSKAIQRSAVEGEGSWSNYLGAGREVMRLDRTININEEFQIISRFYADRNLLKRLWETPMKQLHGANFKHLITRECQLPITDITHFVRYERFDDEICGALELKPKSGGLFMYAVAHSGRNVIVYYQEFFIPPNKRSLQFPEQAMSGADS